MAGRRCTACGHPDRAEIEEHLRRGEPLRAIGRAYGLTHRALGRHRAHMAEPPRHEER